MSKNRELVEAILKQSGIKINGSRPFDIQVHDDRFYDCIGKGDIGVGEAYMDGWWSTERLDQTYAMLVNSDAAKKVPLSFPLVKLVVGSAISNHQNLRKSSKNAKAHYNIGNDLYELMLDKLMVYTCAFWETATNLDDAQVAKLDRVCKKLHLKPGMTILDIGCGWGGFAKYAAENYGVKVTGITLADEQLKVAKKVNKGLPNKFFLQDYRDAKGKFDRVVSIEMMEAVGAKNLRTFFNKCDELLKDDGIMLHQVIGSLKTSNITSPWIDKYIFPGGVLLSMTQLGKATEKTLVIEDVENFGPYYYKTLMAWHANFTKNYPKIKDNYDQRFYRMWEFYLLTCAGGFKARDLQLYQLVVRKKREQPIYKAVR